MQRKEDSELAKLAEIRARLQISSTATVADILNTVLAEFQQYSISVEDLISRCQTQKSIRLDQPDD